MNGVGYLILRLVDLMKNNEIVFEKQKNRIATITFNRPDDLNAISLDGWKEITKISEELKKDDFIRVVVVSGSGDKSFSTGADIKDFEKNRFDSTSAKKYAEYFDGALDSLESLPQPVISMIHGFCVGGGCELSMATDLRIASEGSRFGIPIARLGILIGYSEMRRLVSLVGPGNASYLLLSGKIIDSDLAYKMGLISQVVKEEDLYKETFELAEEMATLSPLTHKRTKLIRDTVLKNPNLINLSEDEKNLPFTNFDSVDFFNARKAFINREKIRFIGE
ncbi:MAG: enoyl-CoA hydratase [Chloroflexi bacterium]|nr:enoyl-CoA hydratase [Chloroflexota bacterium]